MAAERLLNESGMLAVAPDCSIFYQHRPAKGPVWLFLNGLSDDTSSWDPFIAKFEGLHTLQVDLRGQGRSLTETQLNDPKKHLRFPFETNSYDLDKLLESLKLTAPINVVANSFGGGVALDFASRWPERISRIALIAPFVLRLDRAFPMQRILGLQWGLAKSLGLVSAPMAQHFEKSYETFLSHYLNHRYEGRLNDPRLRTVAIELTYEIMKFDAFKILELLPEHGVSMLTSEFDTLSPHSLYQEFWRRLPESKRVKWTQLDKGEHLLLEEVPDLVLAWLREVIHPKSEAHMHP